MLRVGFALSLDRPDNSLDGLVVGVTRGVELQRAGFLIDREAGFQKGVEGGAGILHLEQGTPAATRGTFEEGVGI